MRKLLFAIYALALPALAVDRPPDLTGTPDLIVDAKALQNHWIVREEDFAATACDAIEGGISAGMHRVIRFTVSTPNVGDVDLFIGDPNVHFNNNDGLYELATCNLPVKNKGELPMIPVDERAAEIRAIKAG